MFTNEELERHIQTAHNEPGLFFSDLAWKLKTPELVHWSLHTLDCGHEHEVEDVQPQ